VLAPGQEATFADAPFATGDILLIFTVQPNKPKTITIDKVVVCTEPRGKHICFAAVFICKVHHYVHDSGTLWL
jgi:hypothetical protein